MNPITFSPSRPLIDTTCVLKVIFESDILLPCGTYASDLRAALESDWSDVEDYLIAASTKHISADAMVTRDAEMMRLCPVPAMSAAEVLGKLEDEHGLTYDDIEF